jgi:hypothetical protein
MSSKKFSTVSSIWSRDALLGRRRRASSLLALSNLEPSKRSMKVRRSLALRSLRISLDCRRAIPRVTTTRKILMRTSAHVPRARKISLGFMERLCLPVGPYVCVPNSSPCSFCLATRRFGRCGLRLNVLDYSRNFLRRSINRDLDALWSSDVCFGHIFSYSTMHRLVHNQTSGI